MVSVPSVRSWLTASRRCDQIMHEIVASPVRSRRWKHIPKLYRVVSDTLPTTYGGSRSWAAPSTESISAFRSSNSECRGGYNCRRTCRYSSRDRGASRDRRFRQWVFGSTPDAVIETARVADVPVIAYASQSGVYERVEDYLFPIYRLLRRLIQRRGATPDRNPLEQ